MALDGLSADGMGAILAKQKAAHIRDGIPSAEQREAWIDNSIDLLETHGEALSKAMAEDFGHRSLDQSNLTDIAGSIGALKFSRKHLRKWMRPIWTPMTRC